MTDILDSTEALIWRPAEALRDVADGTVDGSADIYAGLLQQAPVQRLEVPGSKVKWWGVFGHADVTRGVKDFTSLSNTTPSTGPQIIPLQMDPPQHTGFRKLLNPHFTPEAVARVEPAIRRLTTDTLDAIIMRGSADFAAEFAFPIPTRVLCNFMGVPESGWELHHRFVMAMDKATAHGLADPDDPIPMELFAEIFPYLQNLITERRAHPTEDVISGILTAELDGRPLPDEVVLNIIITIMLAGHITTTSTLGNLVLRLARDQELQARLRANPNRIPDAIEESMRVEAAQQAMPRKCVADLELGGQKMKAGDFVLLNFASANVDPAAYPDPATFDLDRAKKRHFSFGAGLHACLGRNLALLQLRIAVEELLARTASFALDGSVSRRTWPVLLVEKMPVTFHPVR